MDYPLIFRFKIAAIAPQIFVEEEGSGRSICYVKQKLFKLKEKIELFTDSSKSTRLGMIEANKVIDWSARYFFTDAEGNEVGSVGRKGMRSFWKATYESFNPGDDVPDFHISEKNPWAKIGDAFFGEIPIVGFFAGYVFHPSYVATRADGTPAMTLSKLPAFWEGKYRLEKHCELSTREELNLMLSFLMLVLLERRRG